MRTRHYVWLALLLAGTLALLHWRFPYVVQGHETLLRIAYSATLFLLVAPALFGRYRHARGLWFKQLLVWLCIGVALMAGYTYRHELGQSRLIAGLLPNRPVITQDGAVVITMAADGHFYIEADIGGTPVNFMVDTGASDIVLSPEDARRAGFFPEELTFTRVYSTANGYGKGAPVVLDSFSVGNILLSGVQATVNGAAMEHSLLGMAFFRQLRGFEVRGDQMWLKP